MSDGREYQAERFYSIFKSKMIDAGKISLSVSQYRHVAIAFMSQHIQTSSSNMENIFAEQGVHSLETQEQIYGRSNNDFQHSSSVREFRFREASEKWQQLIGISTPKKALDMTTQLTDEVVPEIQLNSRKDFMEENLQLMMKTSDAHFLNQEQADLTLKIYSEWESILVVLPTGYGKTLLYQLPIYIEKNYSTVIIVPLLALCLDLSSRFSKFGISNIIWNKNCGLQQLERPPSAIFVIPESINTDFISLVFYWTQQKILRRIVLEECHLFIQWKSIRDVGFQSILKLRESHVPFIYVTGI
jgi:hypothetical protein